MISLYQCPHEQRTLAAFGPLRKSPSELMTLIPTEAIRTAFDFAGNGRRRWGRPWYRL